jgi:protein TonB
VSEQRSGAKPANLPAATAGENDFAGASAIAGNAQKSVEASSGNSAVPPRNNMADRAASDSHADFEANAPVQPAQTGAANTNSGDSVNLAAKDRQQGDDSAPATPSSRNSAADVQGDKSGNSPESSAHQNFGAPVAPVMKRQQAESTAMSAAGAVTAQPFSETQQPVLVTAPDEKSGPFRLTLGEQAVSASATLAISAQRSVSIPAQPGPASAHRPERLQVGVLIYHADPLVPATRDQKGLAGTVKVQATIGKGGDVIEVKPINGPTSLIPAVVQAVREWRYTVTLLDGQPLGTEEEVVVEFRPRS